LGYTRYNPASHRLPAHHADNLYSDDEFFPLEPGLRVEISRTFENNMTFAATFWGLQHWSISTTSPAWPWRRSNSAVSTMAEMPPSTAFPSVCKPLGDEELGSGPLV
jgi:hypothetical protein